MKKADSKNLFENKSFNQIDLFSETIEQDNLLSSIDDWEFEQRLSKEFESVGFFISNHPLNQFKDIFLDYRITDYQNFNNNDINEGNIAATLLKIQERKTAKGNSYAVLKLTDLSSVFELFIFSDQLESNREILKEGKSILLTLTKSFNEEQNRFKRINVKKIVSLNDLISKPIEEVTINLNSINELEEISNFLNQNGDTLVNLRINDENNDLKFQLQNKRSLDRKTLNLIRNKQISAIIS